MYASLFLNSYVSRLAFTDFIYSSINLSFSVAIRCVTLVCLIQTVGFTCYALCIRTRALVLVDKQALSKLHEIALTLVLAGTAPRASPTAA